MPFVYFCLAMSIYLQLIRSVYTHTGEQGLLQCNVIFLYCDGANTYTGKQVF